jgi:hypothetical protein
MDTEGEQEFEVMQLTTMDFPLPASFLSLTGWVSPKQCQQTDKKLVFNIPIAAGD